MDIDVNIKITQKKRDVEVSIQNGMFTQTTLLEPSKSLSTAVARTIAKFFKEHGFLS